MQVGTAFAFSRESGLRAELKQQLLALAAAGSARATAAVNALAGQGVRVAVLAVVSDGLPDPVPAAYRFRLLAPRVGAMARIPFVPLLRAADDPALVGLPRKVRRALAEIRAEALGMAGWAFPGTL